MAIAAASVNNFRTYTKVVGVTTEVVYESPVGYVGVFVMANCANIGPDTQFVDFYHNRVVTGIGTVTTEIVKNFPVPEYDSVKLITGKLILETGDYVTISGSTSTDLKFTMSVIETTI